MTRDELTAIVQRRALQRCEYCLMHEQLQGATFHLEHVAPQSQGGPTALENLAWACPACNLHKSDRVQATDPEMNEPTALFHPRQPVWSEHFEWVGYRLVARSAIGRTTIAAFRLNHERRQRIRRAEELFGLFPPG